MSREPAPGLVPRTPHASDWSPAPGARSNSDPAPVCGDRRAHTPEGPVAQREPRALIAADASVGRAGLGAALGWGGDAGAALIDAPEIEDRADLARGAAGGTPEERRGVGASVGAALELR